MLTNVIMAKDLSNNYFNEWLEFSLHWTQMNSMKKSNVILKTIMQEAQVDTRCGDFFSMYPEVHPAFAMSVLGLENDEV